MTSTTLNVRRADSDASFSKIKGSVTRLNYPDSGLAIFIREAHEKIRKAVSEGKIKEEKKRGRGGRSGVAKRGE